MVIISHKNKFIYIKTRKTASTSIQVLLEKFCGKDDVITPLSKPTADKGLLYNKRARNYKGIISIIKILKYQIKHLLHNIYPILSIKNLILFFKTSNIYKLRIFVRRYVSHMSAEKVRIKVGASIWNKYFKFSFERNPWDKIISFYYFRKPDLSFNEWIKTFSLNIHSQPLNFPLYSINGKLGLDFIGKYENLHQDLRFIFVKLNLPLMDLPHEKSNYRKNYDNYRNFYNENGKKIVEKFYKKEIESFGYSF